MSDASDVALLKKLMSDIDHVQSINKLDYYKPYPWQIKFHNAEGLGTPSKPAQQRLAMCGNKVGKCVSIRTYIDTPDGPKQMRELWGRDVSVLGPDGLPKRVLAWVRKPAEECYRITMSDGRFFECAAGHVLRATVQGAEAWLPISQIVSSLPRSAFPAQCFLGNVQTGVSRLWGTLRGYWDGCFGDFRLRGGRLLSDQEGVLVFAPSQDGAPTRSLLSWRLGDLVDRCTNSVRRAFYRLSNLDVRLRLSALCGSAQVQALGLGYQSCGGERLALRRSSTAVLHSSVTRLNGSRLFSLGASAAPVSICGNRIIRAERIGVHPVYDMQVEGECYTAAGLIHHNTYAHAMEVAYHATGKYPEWWKGTRFLFAPEILVCGPTNELVRDIWQRELFGDPTDEKSLGTGTIPKLRIGKRRPKTGVPNAYDSVRVQHVSGGWSRVFLRAYEQGWKKFQGIAFEYCGSDEEPPVEIWSQLIRAGLARRGSIIVCTMTPEEGLTEVVTGFMENLQKGQAMITATWDDAKHLTPEVKEQRLAALRPHERDMRSKGIPLQGAGLIFCVSDEDLLVDPIQIPDYWRQIIGVDFGISTQHPFSAAKLAIDPDTDTTYLVAEYQTTEERAAVHVADIKKWPDSDWIPVAWPHDGANREKGTGDELQQTYRKEGLTTLLPWKATNPPDGSVGQKEGDGGNSVEKAVLSMLDDMLAGKFKVFRNCQRWMKEKRLYHRDLKGKIVRLHEDLICASRYAHMMKRHADSAARRRAVMRGAQRASSQRAAGIRMWG